jgi:predicted secreted protein
MTAKQSTWRRRLAGLGAAVLMMAGAHHALAGDSAQLDVIGYSADGRIFAFEEWGVQDGSGFAYSTYYFLDTVEDKFLPETPIRVRIEEETSVARIRGLAREKAAPLIRRHALDDHPGYLVAHNPVSETGHDPHRVRFSAFPVSPPLTQTYTLVLADKPFPVPKACLSMADAYLGFSLAFEEERGEPSVRVVHEDAQVPSSRNCPNAYRIGAVVVGNQASAPMIAMIQVSNFGFEGNDERWIAVPLPASPGP